MKRYWRLLVWILYVVILGWVQFRTEWLGWLVGIGLAGVIALIDRLLYVWWLKPFEQLSIQIQYWLKRGDFVAAGRLLYERSSEQTQLVLHSMGFAVLWPVLVVYVLTSTGSVVAIGIVMGLGLDLTRLILSDWKNPQRMANWFCWQIKRPLAVKEMKIVAGGYVMLWILFSLILLVR